MNPSEGLIIAERYRLVRPLGEGGMGSVWLAHHVGLQIPCAVKLMRPEVAATEAYRTRFEREAVAAATIRSPHVVQILDHGVWDGSPYIAMELLEGEDLDQRLSRLGRLSPEETVAVVVQVARALSKAHGAGLVHRDLKPPNIFLVRDDDREIVKVLDFGVAKIGSPTAGGQTRTGAIMGTPYYMSPEQAQGTKTVDHRTDLWALGVVAYQCLTGALPFVSEAFGDLVLKIIVDDPPVPSAIAPVPRGFDAWWARAVARRPEDRFQSAREMADALAVALGVEAPRTAVLLGATTPAEGMDAPRQPIASPSTPPRAPAAGTLAGAFDTARERPRDRSRGSLVAVAIGAMAVLGVAGFLALRAHAPAAQAAQPALTAAPVVAAAQPVPVEAPSAPAAVEAPAPAPSASASAAAVTAPLPSSSAIAAPLPVSSARVRKASSPAAAKTAAPSQGHDIGF